MTSSSGDRDEERPSSYALRRIYVMLGAGLVAAIITGLVSSWWYAGVIGWQVASVVYVAWVWIHLWRLDAKAMQTHSTREDPGVVASDLLIISASIASLAGVALIVVRAKHDPSAQQAVISAVALLSVATSWFLIHTLYAQRYARDYYREPVGGIDFEADDGADPIFSDFAYLSFDLGMTYQVSDTTLHSTQMRKVVLRHTLLSYLFGTVILASTINLVVGLG